MRLQATPLDKQYSTLYFEISEINNIFPDDGVIYIEGTPCHLDSVQVAPIETKDQIIIEIMHLAYLVQRHTNYCVFIEFHGHVEQLEVRIRASKEDWQTKVLDTQFHTEFKKWMAQKDPLAFYKAKRDILKRILDEGEVPYELCDVERYTVEEYSF
jgi:hypothetical protein